MNFVSNKSDLVLKMPDNLGGKRNRANTDCYEGMNDETKFN